jgi:mRNA interferase MazF
VPRRAEPPRRGDIYLAALPEPVGRRPVLLVTRSAAIDIRRAVTVAPITRTIRRIPSQLPLGTRHGLRDDSVANCDSLHTIPKDALWRRLGSLAPDDLATLDRALIFALEIRAS